MSEKQQQGTRGITRTEDMPQATREAWQKWYNLANIALVKCMTIRGVIHEEIEYVTGGHAEMLSLVESGALRVASDDEMQTAYEQVQNLTK